MFEPVAIVGDAAIDAVLDSPVGTYDPYNGIGPKDSEGNVLGVILSGQEDISESSCDVCLQPLEE